MSNQSDNKYIKATANWLQDFVIKDQLCPFAAKVWIDKKVRIAETLNPSLQAQLEFFIHELKLLKEAGPQKCSTSLLLFPILSSDFEMYLNLFYAAEEVLEESKLDVHFQLASFHPLYQFEGTTLEDVSNYTNRSPFPVIHILRVEEVEAAIENYGDTTSIPKRNIELMEKRGITDLQAKLDEFTKMI